MKSIKGKQYKKYAEEFSIIKMLEIDESEFDPHYLPPLTPTPRSLILSQPQSVRSGRSTSRSLVAPQADDTDGKPRWTLKQVSRGHREWTSGLCDCFKDRHLCELKLLYQHFTDIRHLQEQKT